jgi:hypothetical protein
MNSVPAVSRQLFWIRRRKEVQKLPVAFQKESCHHFIPVGNQNVELRMKEKPLA